MHISGGCHCGAITYEAEVDPATVSLCHCTDCQILTGTAYRASVPAKKADFKLLTGTPKIYIKVGESGARRAQGFCGECGTPIYATSAEDPQVYGIRTGTARERHQLLPAKQIWCRSALGWTSSIGHLPKSEKSPA